MTLILIFVGCLVAVSALSAYEIRHWQSVDRRLDHIETSILLISHLMSKSPCGVDKDLSFLNNKKDANVEKKDVTGDDVAVTSSSANPTEFERVH